MPIINTSNSLIPDAVASVHGSELYPDLCGSVFFCQLSCGVFVNAQFHGLPVAHGSNCSHFLGFHIHENGDCSQNEEHEFYLTGNHYNPDNVPHPSHRGDLPPIISCNGYAWQSFLIDTFSVTEIIGKSIIVHANPDDFTTQPSGNSGVKIGCGIIKLND